MQNFASLQKWVNIFSVALVLLKSLQIQAVGVTNYPPFKNGKNGVRTFLSPSLAFSELRRASP